MSNKLKSFLKGVLPASKVPKVGTSNEETRSNWIRNTLKMIPAGGKILDAGAGEQPFRQYCSHLEYTSQDFGQYNPNKNNSGLHMGSWDYGTLDIISDIATIPRPNDSFDAILCTEVLEHIINPREALKEFSRLLKKEGYLILTAPFSSMTHFAPYHYYTGFSQFFYDKELTKMGYEIIEIKPNGNYYEFLAQEIRRVNSIASKYSTDSFSSTEEKAATLLLHALERFSKGDKGSSELLVFGWHVFAQKK